MKKIISLALALIMILSLATTAFAEGTGSIKITNATKNVEYSIYKVFDLTYSGTGSDQVVSYTYTKTGDSDALYSALTSADSPFTLTASVAANVYNVSTTDDSATIAAWLKNNANLLTKTAAQVATGATVTFNNVDFGYYYVTSTLGTVVTINSAMPNAEVKDKNIAPTIEKKVQEENESWGVENDAEFNETVNFKIVIKAYAGAQNYELSDTLPAGLTLNTDSIVVTDKNGELEKNKDYTVTATTAGFTIEFVQDYLNKITDTTEKADEITVTYSAVLNQNALVAGDGNENTAVLKYGANSAFTTEATTTTYTWGLNVVKYGDGNEDKRLSGVEFVLLNSDATKVATVVATVDGYNLTGWTDVPADGTSWPADTTLITDGNGKIVVNGLDAGDYKLRETKALPGYNKLTKDEDFKIENAIAKVEINNQSGSVLPDTGGMGTTLFYVLGSLMAVGAMVLLVTKKRMNVA